MTSVEPIGMFHCGQRYAYDAPRQGTLSEHDGVVELQPGRNFEQALTGLEGFSRVWLLYLFHHNPNWKPMVKPPRGDAKIGVFATRAPYRPNPIGLSCVELVGMDGLRVFVRGHDLLDGTPILDIKPYLPYADSFPEAAAGWTEQVAAEETWTIDVAPAAAEQLAWLAAQGLPGLNDFIRRELGYRPFDDARKRVRQIDPETGELAYRTWRFAFTAVLANRQIIVMAVTSGYTPAELADPADPYTDKSLHRAFFRRFP
jgi:tRNA-Thr(GGU) m(6)t(6)A37 methyltransferase TsaA